MQVEHGNQKYFKIYMYYIVKIDVFREILNGTMPKTETLKLVFTYLYFVFTEVQFLARLFNLNL